MTESDAGYAAVDKGEARTPADEETQQAREDVRPGEDDDVAVVGVDVAAEPTDELISRRHAARLAGPRTDEQQAEMADEGDIPEA